MGIVLAILGAGCGVAAWRADERAVRWAFVVFAAINFTALGFMAAEGNPYLFRLQPNDLTDGEW